MRKIKNKYITNRVKCITIFFFLERFLTEPNLTLSISEISGMQFILKQYIRRICALFLIGSTCTDGFVT
jgi:HKD family nuclease